MTAAIPDFVYHYTNHEAFTKILRSKEMWAHDSRLSNDRRETDYALGLMTVALDETSKESGFKEYVGRIVEAVKDPFHPFKLQDLEGYLLIASFSEEPNLLSQWRAYAPENGYSLGFNAAELKKSVEAAGFSFGSVTYKFPEAVSFLAQRLKAYLKDCIKRYPANEPVETCLERFTSLLGSIVPLVKHDSFSEEKEWRAFRFTNERQKVRFYSGRRSLTPYMAIQLSDEEKKIASLGEVIVGPSDDQHVLAEWTGHYLGNLGYATYRGTRGKGVRIFVSGSPYRLRK